MQAGVELVLEQAVDEAVARDLSLALERLGDDRDGEVCVVRKAGRVTQQVKGTSR